MFLSDCLCSSTKMKENSSDFNQIPKIIPDVFKSNCVCHLMTRHCRLLQRTTQCVHPAPQQWCGSCRRPLAPHCWYPSPEWARSDSGCHCDLRQVETQENRDCCKYRKIAETKQKILRNKVRTKSAKVPFSPRIKLSIVSHSSTVSVASGHTNNNL